MMVVDATQNITVVFMLATSSVWEFHTVTMDSVGPVFTGRLGRLRLINSLTRFTGSLQFKRINTSLRRNMPGIQGGS
jgi:hypothetical protein